MHDSGQEKIILTTPGPLPEPEQLPAPPSRALPRALPCATQRCQRAVLPVAVCPWPRQHPLPLLHFALLCNAQIESGSGRAGRSCCEGRERWSCAAAPRGRALLTSDTSLVATTAPECHHSWMRGTHGHVPVPKAGPLQGKALPVPKVQRGCVIVSGETESRNGKQLAQSHQPWQCLQWMRAEPRGWLLAHGPFIARGP